jgi:beta-glucosidase-like glycosyl hydrolase/CubicO group peptidase (beta-lactamase class C family)
MRKRHFILFFLLLPFTAICQPAARPVPLPAMKSDMNRWVDSIYNMLSIEQRIGQLYMIAAYSGGEKYNQPAIEKLILERQIGGLIFMQGTATAQAEQTNKYQLMSKVPLLLAMDAEWGLGMRLTGIRDMPRQIMLGAMRDSTIVYKMASAIASQCRRMGVHINFAPVVDINNNPENPVINFRSYGENKWKVANYGIQYMNGLQDNGVMACAKHFPGHGDTDMDSHKDMPEISKSYAELENLELYPFKKLIDNGLQSAMIAHLHIPALDQQKNIPSTLSYKTVTSLLKGKMGFNGLIFTDALNMEGVAKYYEPGDIDLKAFLAGNDILLFSQDVNAGVKKIKAAIDKDSAYEQQLESTVKKILRAKYQAGLHAFKPISTDSLDRDLNQYTSPIRNQIAAASVTLLGDPYQITGQLKKYDLKNMAYVGVGLSSENTFVRELKKYGITKIFYAPADEKGKKDFLKKFKNNTSLIIGIHNMSGYPTQNFGLDKTEIDLINQLAANNNSLAVLFGNPYALKNFCNIKGIMVTYDEAEETQETAVKILTGQLKTQGKLPVSVCGQYKAGDGIVSMTNILGQVIDTVAFRKQNKTVNPLTEAYNSKFFDNNTLLECCVSPQAVGADMKVLDKLDNFIESAIRAGVFPGCRILASKDGKVFYDKAFGYLTQDKKNLVDINTVYDVASVTKVVATTMAVMKLYDQGKISLDAYIGKYVPATRGTDKEYLKIKDILTHQAGLKSWVPFYKETLDEYGYPKSGIYNKVQTGKFSIRVSDNLFMNSEWIDTMWNRIVYSPLENRGKYVYSDLDFILLQKAVEQISKQSLDNFVYKEFYMPLGMKSTAFNAKIKLPKAEIAPSEIDNYFRHQVVQGYVHDMGAAMFGGVSGHAGIFSTPNDIGILFQMLLNGGVYNGKRYFQKSTVDLFTSKNSFISRRGLGFDKPETKSGKGNPCCDNASSKTFGHQGFTGTCVWADPESNLIFVFLSNRTYPTADNKLINSSWNVRENAQQYIYNALGMATRSRN